MVKNTIESVAGTGLCVGCGTCSAMCPANAITLTINNAKGIYLPKIDFSKCVGCSICVKCCPGFEVNFKELSKGLVSQCVSKENRLLLGNYENCYVGYSSNCKIRFDSSSGGVVTQLLLFAMDENLVDGVVVTRMNRKHPLLPEPFIARTREEILEASKSKYCPVPTNIALREVLQRDGRYAFVGLPCHIHGLRKAQKLNKTLAKRIVLSIGLFCSHNDSFHSTRYILNRLNVNPSDVSRIDYRGKGWPGLLTVEQKSGIVTTCAFHDWIRVHEYCFFTPDRCLVCCDHAAELADISAGDAWLPEILKDHAGTSIFISRSKVGEELLHLAKSKGDILFQTIDSNKVVQSQGNVRFKKNGFVVRSWMFRVLTKNIPKYIADFPQSGLIELPRSLIIFVNRTVASSKYSNDNVDRLISSQIWMKKLYNVRIVRNRKS